MPRINPWHLFTGAFIPNWLLPRSEVTSGAKICYARLTQYAGANGCAWPDQETLAMEIGSSRRTVIRYIEELEGHGLIESVQRGKAQPNVYYFLYHVWMKGHVEDDPVKCQSVTSGSDTDGTSRSDNPGKSLTCYEENQKKRINKTRVSDIPPIPEEVEAYFSEKGQPGRGEEFMDYYQARGWNYKGNVKMRDWRAAVRVWLKNGSSHAGSNGHDTSLNSMTLQESAAIELERIRILGLCPENA